MTDPTATARHLTPRQRELITLRCQHGMTNAQAAAALGLAESTVKNHMSTLHHRFHQRSMNRICFEFGRVTAVASVRPDEV